MQSWDNSELPKGRDMHDLTRHEYLARDVQKFEMHASSFGGKNRTPPQKMIDYIHMLSLKFAPIWSLTVNQGSLLHTGMH